MCSDAVWMGGNLANMAQSFRAAHSSRPHSFTTIDLAKRSIVVLAHPKTFPPPPHSPQACHTLRLCPDIEPGRGYAMLGDVVCHGMALMAVILGSVIAATDGSLRFASRVSIQRLACRNIKVHSRMRLAA